MARPSKEKHLIIGAGEVGRALFEVLKDGYDVLLRDKQSDLEGRFDVLHIAYPPFKDFVSVTKNYVKQYRPKLVVIHATVPVGVTKKVGLNAVHSPIRGVHPHLAAGIRTFVKYFGGAKAKEAAKIFAALGVKTQTFQKAETTELAKILDTTYYGWNIIFAKEAERLARKFKLDFDEVYTVPNKEYNEGYRKLGKPNVARPVLKAMPGKIGGHCVVPNCDLLDDWLTNTLKNRNKAY